MRNRNRTRRVPPLVKLGLLLIAAALLLSGRNVWQNEEAGKQSREALGGLRAALTERDAAGDSGERPGAPTGTHALPGDGLPAQTGGPPEGSAAAPESSNGPSGGSGPAAGEGTGSAGAGEALGAADLRERVDGLVPGAEEVYENWELNPRMDMPETDMYGYRYIAVLELPSLGLELPVMSRWDYHRLRIAPCRYEGSAYTDDLVIAAHNYQSHFGRLSSLRLGDAAALTDMDGNVFRYRVAEVTTLQPGAVGEMTSGEWPLTLFTCTVDGRQRVTVRCEKAE